MKKDQNCFSLGIKVREKSVREECEVKKQIDMNYTLTPFRIMKV